jgi:hypothetical protein
LCVVHDLICTRFEDFNPQEIVYDIILFQESAQYIQAKDIFQKSYNLLSPHGKILIVDEFSIGKIDLHEIDDFVNIARQFEQQKSRYTTFLNSKKKYPLVPSLYPLLCKTTASIR